MRKVLVLCVALLFVTGCRKKSVPEFYALESSAGLLVNRGGDDAWTSPEMDAVVTGLQAIPSGSLEAPRAAELLAKINAERARLAVETSERDRLQKERASRPPPSLAVFDARPAPVEVAEPVDAGPPPEPKPTAGMPLAEFSKLFGACFKAGPPLEIPGAQKASSQLVLDTPPCRKRFGTREGDTSYVFADGKFAGTRTSKSTTTITVIDAGPPPPPPPPPPELGLRYPGQPAYTDDAGS